MNKKDVIKAFFAGVFSITPFVGNLSQFKPIDLSKPVIEPKKSSTPAVKVELIPIIEEVGKCFDEAGEIIRDAAGKIRA